ncbi:MAG: RDD family protein [Epsilonproteobacteria bacterium]|nr:RDD family protein [Campylobacterota bacterium]
MRLPESRESIPYAPLGRRMLAYALDDLLISLIFVAALWEELGKMGSPEAVAAMLNAVWLYMVMVKIAYHTLFVWQYGASLGKIAMGMRVVRASDNGPVGFGTAFNRAIFRVISEIVMYLGFVIAFFDPRRQTLHDKTSSTVVINA